MNGITIIEEHICRVVDMPTLISTCVFFTLICVGILAFYRWAYKDTKIKSIKILIICFYVGVVIICIALWIIQFCNYNKTHMEYTVTIDDSVSFNDFHAKYEIVSVNGNEYRVLEK